VELAPLIDLFALTCSPLHRLVPRRREQEGRAQEAVTLYERSLRCVRMCVYVCTVTSTYLHREVCMRLISCLWICEPACGQRGGAWVLRT
jgi:hypothetical protein